MADGDITIERVKPDGVKEEINSVHFYAKTKICKVVYDQIDGSGDVVGQTKDLFRNVADDPETPEDESLTDFTALIKKINNESNLKNSITEAVLILRSR